MPKPSGEWLAEDIAYYASVGVTQITSLIEKHEAAELGLQNEQQACQAAGLQFVSFPIQDYGLPERDAFVDLANQTRAQIEQGACVAIHCRAGIGRSGMLSCTILAPWLGSMKSAIEEVCAARRVAVPDTQEQRLFIEGLYGQEPD
ncbi:MAG: protein-tyrosine phosphatase family protein [Pseudomonadota bacterium]